MRVKVKDWLGSIWQLVQGWKLVNFCRGSLQPVGCCYIQTGLDTQNKTYISVINFLRTPLSKRAKFRPQLWAAFNSFPCICYHKMGPFIYKNRSYDFIYVNIIRGGFCWINSVISRFFDSILSFFAVICDQRLLCHLYRYLYTRDLVA